MGGAKAFAYAKFGAMGKNSSEEEKTGRAKSPICEALINPSEMRSVKGLSRIPIPAGTVIPRIVALSNACFAKSGNLVEPILFQIARIVQRRVFASNNFIKIKRTKK